MPRKKKATKKKTPKKKKPSAKVLQKKISEFDPDKLLLWERQIFLNTAVEEKSANTVIKQLLALDKLGNIPIILWINSPGGSIMDGLAIIDAMDSINSEVITIINGSACSMAGLISICGDKRAMTPNSIWMAHDGYTRMEGNFEKIFDRVEGLVKELQKKIFAILRNRTELDEKDLERARHGELWLFAKDCQQKKIVDAIIRREA